MTLDAVRTAVHALQADGRYPSERAVMARLGCKSKRAIAQHLKMLRDENPALFAQPVAIEEPDPPPAPIAEPEVVHDPVRLAQQRLAQAEAALEDARTHLLTCKLQLLATKNLIAHEVLVGTLHPQDPAHLDALTETRDAKRLYDFAWTACEDAKAHLRQMEAVHLRGQQEKWVELHNPDVVATLFHWSEKLRTAPSARMHAEAKKNHMQALQAYEFAVRSAPTSNGVHP